MRTIKLEETITLLLESEGAMPLVNICAEVARARGRASMNEVQEALEDGPFTKGDDDRWRTKRG